MKLSDLSPVDRAGLGVACHEAAHAVLAAYLGAEVESVTIDHDSAEGLTTLAAAVSAETERRVAYAGAWASARWECGERPALSSIIASLRDNPTDWEAVVRTDAGLPREDERLLETLWPAITQVAKTLFITGRADHAAVCAAIGFDGTNDDPVRASIKMGDAPGSFTVHAPLAG